MELGTELRQCSQSREELLRHHLGLQRAEPYALYALCGGAYLRCVRKVRTELPAVKGKIYARQDYLLHTALGNGSHLAAKNVQRL